MSPAEIRALVNERAWITVPEAAEIFGVGKSTAYEAINRGTFRVPVVKVTARKWIVPTAHLVAVLGLDAPQEVVRLRAVP